jgi:ABC-type nitrate/sulfonate/bicarbonate transport system ATPase subunit
MQSHAMNTPIPYRTGERLLTIEKLGLSYDKPVLANISVSIDNIIREGMSQGQVVCLLGPSGIGKTQLFRCIAGLQAPSAGGVFLNGRRTVVVPGEVGVVAQNYPLLNHRTVLGNLMVAARTKVSCEKDALERSLEMLRDFGLEGKALCYPASLSGGQRQRIAIAQQLLCSSHFLLMDEPFSGLDPHAKHKVCETVLKVSTMDELNTIIVVTHDIEASLCIADTLWLLGRDFDKNGRPLPGAGIKYKYDLIARGLAWHRDIQETPEFFELARELKQRFTEL